jgi:hypothetical protein
MAPSHFWDLWKLRWMEGSYVNVVMKASLDLEIVLCGARRLDKSCDSIGCFVGYLWQGVAYVFRVMGAHQPTLIGATRSPYFKGAYARID